MGLGARVLSMMTRVLLTFLVGLVVSLGALASLGSSAAFADTFNCERYTYSGSETSHPKTINLEINGWKKVRSGSKALLKYDKGRKCLAPIFCTSIFRFLY